MWGMKQISAALAKKNKKHVITGDCFALLAMTTPCPAHHPKNKNMLLRTEKGQTHF
jgi:hypothetical protein